MASEASWQTSSAGRPDPFAADEPMDQRTVEGLLRRLVERVEESERRYGEALDELHARLDQLSQTTEAAREAGSPEDADTFDRLHTQVSNLARRLEQESTTPLDDFERLGRALSGSVSQSLSHEEVAPEASGQGQFAAKPETSPFAAPPEPSSFGGAAAPSRFAQAVMAGTSPETPVPAPSFSDFDFDVPEEPYRPAGTKELGAEFGDLDKRLVDIAQRLEQSIGSAMPTTAIEALNARLDDIGGQLGQVLEKVPTRDAIEHIERQISDMAQQLNRAEEQLGKVAGIEAHLIKLIERVDEKASAQVAGQLDQSQIEAIASKAATEAARLVASDVNKSAERFDAIQRDVSAMSTKSRESGDRLVSTLEAVHDSLKQLVQQVERGAPAFQSKPRAPFTERARQTEAKVAAPLAQPHAAASPASARAPEKPAAPAKSEAAKTLRDRLGPAIPDFNEAEPQGPFGRAKRPSPDEEAVDLDAMAQPRRGGMRLDAKPDLTETADAARDAPDDLVAAARRAAQAAALRAEERGGRRSKASLPGSGPVEQPGRRKRSILFIAAAALLLLSAALLYGRLVSKSEPETTMPGVEEITPAPADKSEDALPPSGAESAPSNDGIVPITPDQSGAWEPLPEQYQIPNEGFIRQGETTGVTDIAKSSASSMPEGELNPEPQLASLKPDEQAMLPPGVIFSIEDPAAGAETKAAAEAIAIAEPAALAMPAKLDAPPEALGPRALREAAANGDAAAQYVIAVNYAEGKGTKSDLKQAAMWLEQAAIAGLAPAQYRLAAMYERGLGVDKNIDRARSWYLAAAEKGNIKAMHNLAVSLSGRDGGPADYAQAAKWYGRAADYGLADSQFNLGILAEHGLGITRDLSEAYKWFALAAARGDAEAAKRREVIRLQLDPATLAGVEAAVKAWQAKGTLAEANTVANQPAWAAAAAREDSLVTRAQTLLNKLGYDVGPPDGVAGERTRSAIKLFERRNGLLETGEVSTQLVTTLEALAS